MSEACAGTVRNDPHGIPGWIRRMAGITGVHVINDMYFPVLMALQPVFITSLGYSYFQAAGLPVLHCLLSAIFQPVFGYLSDKRGLRIRLGISLLLSGCGIALLGLISDYYAVMLVCVALSALGHAGFHIGAFSTVFTLSSSGSRGRLMSFFIGGGCLGQALGPIVCGILVTAGGLSAIPWLIIPVLMGGAVLFFLPVTDTRRAGTAAAVTRIRTSGPVLLLVTGATLRYWVILGSLTFLPTFLVMAGYPLLEAGVFISLMIIAGIAGQLAGGFLSDRTGRKAVVVATTCAAIPAFIAILVTHGTLLLVSIMLFGFFLWSSYSVSITLAQELAPEQFGLVTGLMVGFATGAGSCGVAVSGILADTFGLPACLVSLALVLLGAVLVFLGVDVVDRTRGNPS